MCALLALPQGHRRAPRAPGNLWPLRRESSGRSRRKPAVFLMTANLSLRKSGLVWLSLSAFVIGVDQLTKAIAIDALQLSVAHPVIPGFLNWTLAFNTGAAFSFLADQQGWQRW